MTLSASPEIRDDCRAHPRFPKFANVVVDGGDSLVFGLVGEELADLMVAGASFNEAEAVRLGCLGRLGVARLRRLGFNEAEARAPRMRRR